MARYEGMTHGQTVFLRRLRRMDLAPATNEPPHLWLPSRETMRRWMENPAFREAYAKARQASGVEVEASLPIAGAGKAADIRAGSDSKRDSSLELGALQQRTAKTVARRNDCEPAELVEAQ